MKRATYVAAAVILNALFLTATLARADEIITNYQWTGALAPPADWKVDGNWNVSGFPNDALAGAEISTSADLSLNIGTSPVTVAAITLDATAADTDIDISAGTGGKLLFNNSDDNTYFSVSGIPDLAPSE